MIGRLGSKKRDEIPIGIRSNYFIKYSYLDELEERKIKDETMRAILLGVYHLDGTVKVKGQGMRRSYSEMVGKEGDFLKSPINQVFIINPTFRNSIDSKAPAVDFIGKSKSFAIQWASDEGKGFHTSKVLTYQEEGDLATYKTENTIFKFQIIGEKVWENYVH